MNIPGLDAPTWSRVSGTDEAQEEEDEAIAEAQWQAEQQQQQRSGVTWIPASGAASNAPLQCDLLVIACGMMSSAFLAAVLDRSNGATDASSASPAAAATTAGIPSSLRELGRFTLSSPPSPSSVGVPSSQQSDLAVGSSATKAARTAAARPYALVLAAPVGEGGDGVALSTVYAFSYLRPAVSQLFEVSEALFAQVAPRRGVIALDTLHQANYISTERPAPCPPLLRTLQTTSASASGADGAVPQLEAPNMVYSLSSAVLSRAEAERLPARLYVSVESRHYVLECLQAFETVLRTGSSSAAQQASASPSSSSSSSSSSSTPSFSSHFLAASQAFLAQADLVRAKQLKQQVRRLQDVYAYAPGQDSSVRQTAAEVQGSGHIDSTHA
jgi:hypothetical protein